MKNRIREILLELNLISEDTIEPFYSRVRDRVDVAVARDTSSGIIFLDRTDHVDLSHYEQIPEGLYWGGKSREEALKNYHKDDERHAAQFKSFFADKDVIDIGCGTGGLLDLIKMNTKSIAGVEPQEYLRTKLTSLGYPMYRVTEDVPDNSFDIATLFHTLEHLVEPIETLTAIHKKLRNEGTLIVEVPHARDVLLELEPFKKFSLWSEHLILHTKESLRVFLERAGFTDIEIIGFQRYSTANHLGWLATGLPGGQEEFPELANDQLSTAYRQMLLQHERTDTLIALAHT